MVAIHKRLLKSKKALLIAIMIVVATTSFVFIIKSNQDSNLISIQDTTSQQTKTDIKPKIMILEVLKTIPDSMLPKDFAVEVKSAETEKIQINSHYCIDYNNNNNIKPTFYSAILLRSNKNSKIIGISTCSYKKDKTDTSKEIYLSDFYFIENVNNRWKAATLAIFPPEAKDYISLKLDGEFVYNRSIFTENLFSYTLVSNHFGTICRLDYDKVTFNKIVFNSSNEKPILSPLLVLTWEGDKFSIETTEDTTDTNLLAEDELDNQISYTSIDEALADSGKVYILDLSSQNINNLDVRIGEFKHLQILILKNNNLSSLPESIRNLKKLQILNLEGNNFKSIPSSITDFIFLEELSLGNNQITKIPKQISQLINLKKLNLAENKITELPSTICLLNKLVILNLDKNPIKDLPVCFNQLTNLIYLTISETNIENLQTVLKKMERIEFISIDYDDYSKEIITLKEEFPKINFITEKK